MIGKVLLLEANRYSSASIELLRKHFSVAIADSGLDQRALHDLIKKEQYLVIFTRLGLYFGPREMECQRKLKYLVTPTTGLNHIDISEANRLGIKIISLKGETAFLEQVQSTAEHAWALSLILARQIVPAFNSVKEGYWDRSPYIADELNTKTIGIIGLGRLGKMIYRYSKAFNMKVLISDINPEVFDEQTIKFSVSKSTLLANSDYVFLMVDFREESSFLMDWKDFNLMKPTSYFINTSRGELIREEALLNALMTNRIAGAALDVISGDSAWSKVPLANPLVEYARKNDNLIITPHSGGYGKISIESTRDFVIKKLIEQLNENDTYS